MKPLEIPPMPESVGPIAWDIEAWGSTAWQTAQREAALADELAEALRAVEEEYLDTHTLAFPALDAALTKYKEARNG